MEKTKTNQEPSKTKLSFDLINNIVNSVTKLAGLYIVIEFIKEDDILPLLMKNPLDAAVLVGGVLVIMYLGKSPSSGIRTPSYPINYQPQYDNSTNSNCNNANCPRKGNDEH